MFTTTIYTLAEKQEMDGWSNYYPFRVFGTIKAAGAHLKKDDDDEEAQYTRSDGSKTMHPVIIKCYKVMGGSSVRIGDTVYCPSLEEDYSVNYPGIYTDKVSAETAIQDYINKNCLEYGCDWEWYEGPNPKYPHRIEEFIVEDEE